MAHAGTMDLGRGVQTKQGGGPRPLVALMVAGIVAIVAVVWLATGFGQAGGATTTLIESRTEAMNEARAAGTLSIDTSLKGIPYVDTLSAQEYLDNILDRAHATPFVETVKPDHNR